MLAAVVAAVGAFELLLRLGELLVGVLDVSARPMERPRQLVDGTGVTGVQLVLDGPWVTTGGGDQFICPKPLEVWFLRHLNLRAICAGLHLAVPDDFNVRCCCGNSPWGASLRSALRS
jgi:hypothetical protein